jgi:hypothetical protein
MRNIAQTILLSAGILLSLTGCQKGSTVGGGKDVTFKASTQNHETRTAYGEVYTEGNTKYQRINWVEGDKILVWSDNAVVKNDLTHPSFSSNNTHIATYSITNVKADGRKSIANIADPAGRGLHYLDDSDTKYAFWGIYPAGAVTENPSVNNSAVFSLPDDQTGAEPDMNTAFMTAVALNTTADSPVELQFYPAFTTFEFTLEGGDDNYRLEINKFTLESEGEGATALAGDYTATCTNGTWTYDCRQTDNTSNIITVTFPESVVITSESSYTFRFFALPQDLKNLRITFWTNEGTKSTKLMKKGTVDQSTGSGDYMTFTGTKYHKIKGLVLPAGMIFSYITLDLQVLEWQTTNMTGVSEEFPQSTQFSVTGAKNGSADLSQGDAARQKWYFKPGETVTVTFKMMLPAGGSWEVVPMGGEEGNAVAADANLFTIKNLSPDATSETALYGPINNTGSTDVKLEITYNGSDTAQHSFYFLTYAYTGANRTGEKYNIDSETQLYDRGRGYHTFYVNSPLYN